MVKIHTQSNDVFPHTVIKNTPVVAVQPPASHCTMKLFLLLSVASLATAGPAAAGSQLTKRSDEQLTKRSDEQLTKQLVKRDAEPSPDAAPDADPAADPQVSPLQVPVDIKFN